MPLTAFGQTKSIEAWARDRRAVVNAQTIRDRVRDGVDPETAISAVRVRHGKRGKARPYRAIDWDRVAELRHLSPAEIARRLKRSETAIRVGMRERGWFQRPSPISELPHGTLLYRVWNVTLRLQGATAWPDFASFHAWALKSGYAPGLFLTRPDRAQPASPKNAAWLPVRESWGYRRPKTVRRVAKRKVRAFGETKGVAEWARDPRCVVTAAGLRDRLERGMKPKDAITKRKRREADYRSSKPIEAWGTTNTLAAWARDRRAKVGPGAIAARLRRGGGPRTRSGRRCSGGHGERLDATASQSWGAAGLLDYADIWDPRPRCAAPAIRGNSPPFLAAAAIVDCLCPSCPLPEAPR